MSAWNRIGEIVASPWTLLWGVAAAIPVAVHLYGRVARRTIDLPTTRFLFDEPDAMLRPGRRLLEPWRLAMRCTVILLVVLAAAMTGNESPPQTGGNTQTGSATQPDEDAGTEPIAEPAVTTEPTGMAAGASSIRVLLIGPDPANGATATISETATNGRAALRWVAAAMAPLGEDGPVALTRGTAATLFSRSLERFDCVWLVDPARPDDATAAVLRRYVESGGCVVLFAGKEWDAADARIRIAPLSGDGGVMETWLPATVGAGRSGALRAKAAEILTTSQNPPDAPDTEYAVGAGNTAEFPILRWRELTPRNRAAEPQREMESERKTESGRAAGRVRWRSAEGVPLLVESEYGNGNGKILLFAFGLTPADTPLVVLPEFVPLVQETLRDLSHFRHSPGISDPTGSADPADPAAMRSERGATWWKSATTWLFGAAIVLWLATLFGKTTIGKTTAKNPFVHS